MGMIDLMTNAHSERYVKSKSRDSRHTLRSRFTQGVLPGFQRAADTVFIRDVSLTVISRRAATPARAAPQVKATRAPKDW